MFRFLSRLFSTEPPPVIDVPPERPLGHVPQEAARETDSPPVDRPQLLAQLYAERLNLARQFLELAGSFEKPRGLKWLSIDWQPGERLAIDRTAGIVTALVPLVIRFEIIPGSDMEGIEFATAPREAVGLFHWRPDSTPVSSNPVSAANPASPEPTGGSWGTGGKALFNLSPAEVLLRLNTQYAEV